MSVEGSATTSPGVPAAATVWRPTSTTLDVTWTAVPGATLYHIYRSTASSGPFNADKSVSGTTTTDTGLAPNTVYFYQLKACSTSCSTVSSTGSNRTSP